MSKIDKKSVFLLCILSIYLVFYCTCYRLFYNTIDSVITPLFWLIMCIFAFILNKNNIYKVKGNINKLQIIIIIVLSYLIIYFPTGFIFGYGKNIYSQNFIAILKNFWQIILVIIFSEYIRNVILTSSKRSKIISIITFIIYTLYTINIYTFINQCTSFSIGFQKTSLIIIPAIALNLLLNYLTINSGYLSCLIYRIPLSLASILLPILPKLNWFYESIINILLPFIVFISIKTMTDKKQLVRERPVKTNYLKYIPLISILTIFILFTAGILHYKPVAILSNSMKPSFSRGDLVIVEKLMIKILKP